jgi:poly-gamma-glutamate synthesis protein (capsule biosynthesis protein)
MFFPTVDLLTGRLSELQLTPMQIRNFRLNWASRAAAGWLRDTINRESRRFDFRVELRENDRFELRRSRPSSGLGRQA